MCLKRKRSISVLIKEKMGNVETSLMEKSLRKVLWEILELILRKIDHRVKQRTIVNG